MSSTLIVQAEVVARRLEIPLPLSEDDRYVIESEIRDAQAVVEGYLGRPIEVREITQTGLRLYPKGFRLKTTPVVKVVSVTADLDGTDWLGTYTVVYQAGLDAANDLDMEPIRLYVRLHAMYSPGVQALLRRVNPEAARKVTDLSVTGQSVKYKDVYSTDDAKPGTGVPGALPTLASLDRWRVAGRRVYVRPSEYGSAAPWPYGPDLYFSARERAQWWW